MENKSSYTLQELKEALVAFNNYTNAIRIWSQGLVGDITKDKNVSKAYENVKAKLPKSLADRLNSRTIEGSCIEFDL